MADSTTPKVYRCEYCKNDHAEVRAVDGLMVCNFCDDVCTRRFICDVCHERDVANGAEQCIECIADQVVADPEELHGCSKSLQAEVAHVLAKRLKPFMRQRQAA
jgi:hypothetical protein